MTTDFIYTYSDLIPGVLIKRYKRFLADIKLTTGEIITAHCPNTGPMTRVCNPSSLVQVSKSDNLKRKLAYTWEMIQVNGTWVGVNTGLPNRVIKSALENQIFPELALENYQILSEVPYGKDKKSRIDILFKSLNTQPDIYIEIKNVTLAEKNLALFPDTVTTRGQKHLQELMNLPANAMGIMLYFINRGDCDSFAPCDQLDAVYGELLREAVKKGVKVLPYRFEISPQGIRYLGLAKFLDTMPSKALNKQSEIS